MTSRLASVALQRARTLRVETIDDRYEAIAEQVEGFGGAFRGADGNVYAYVTDPARQASAAQAIADRLPGSLRGKNVRLLRGQYDFTTLRRWKRIAVELHNVPGVSFTDADETRNRVAIGVADETAAARVRAALGSLGIPDAAVVTKIRPRMDVASTLQDAFATRRGALAVTGAPDGPGGPGYHCTIGFVVRMDTSDYGPAQHPLWDAAARYAVTNSHCGGTQYMGQVKGKLFQYAAFASNEIGVEFLDPPFYSQANNPWAGIWNCPTGRTCRLSDAAAYKFNNPASAANGTMARTLGPPTYQTVNSLTIDASAPTFNLSHYYRCYPYPVVCVTDPWVSVAVGDTVYKIGSATGWTYGTVTGTCMDEPMLENGVDLLKTVFCQTEVSSRVSAGDSGSPVFVIWNGSVHAAGLLWGPRGARPIKCIPLVHSQGSI